MSDATDLVREITEFLEQVSRTSAPDEIRAGRQNADQQSADQQDADPRLGVHPRGKLASWVLAATVVTAFATGGSALIAHLWWLFGVSLAVVIGAVPAGKAIGIMNDAVVTAPPPRRTGTARSHRPG